MTWDRPEWRTTSGHPEARIGRAYTDRYVACITAGFGQADAREQATQEAERKALEVRHGRT